MAAVQASSLLDIAAIADAPGEVLPHSRPELSTEPRRVVFYILAVPGTQDVILTTLRPSEKATAVDISQSFYYLYYSDPNATPAKPENGDVTAFSNASSSPSTITEELEDQLSEEIHRWNFPESNPRQSSDERRHPALPAPRALISPRQTGLLSLSLGSRPYEDKALPIPPPDVVEIPLPLTSQGVPEGHSRFSLPPPYGADISPEPKRDGGPVSSVPESCIDDGAPPIPQRHKIRRKPVGIASTPNPIPTRSSPNHYDTTPTCLDTSPNLDRQPGGHNQCPAPYTFSSRFEVSPVSSFPSSPPPTRAEASPERSYGTPPRLEISPRLNPYSSLESMYGFAPPSPPASNGPNTLMSTLEDRRPLGPRPLKIRKDSLNSTQMDPFRPQISLTPPSQQSQPRAIPRRRSVSKRDIILIRRDPFSGSQTNIGTITLQDSGVSYHKHKNSPFVVDLSTAGYTKYLQSLGQVQLASESSYECHVDYKNGGDVSPPKHTSFSHRRFGSIPDAKESMAAMFATDHSRPKGYTFASPWGSNCMFSTGKTGRSMKCKVEKPRSTHGPYYDYEDDEEVLNLATVSELRFNLPLLHLASSTNMRTAAGFISPPTSPIKSSASSFFSAAKEKASFLRRSRASLQPNQNAANQQHSGHGRSQSASEIWFSSVVGSSEQDSQQLGERPDRYAAYSMNSSQTPSPPKYNSYFSTSKEEKDSLNVGGGGIRGKDVKLGKLIVEAEGLKMLDLVVAVNMGIWWQAWERSMK